MDKKAYFARGQEIVKRLNDLTYEAYFVGGVVRDYLMGVEFSDIDIATSATPEQLLLEFPNLDMRFASNGCCILREGEFVYEINTFREETYLNRTRKPSQVHFSMNLREDVTRLLKMSARQQDCEQQGKHSQQDIYCHDGEPWV